MANLVVHKNDGTGSFVCRSGAMTLSQSLGEDVHNLFKICVVQHASISLTSTHPMWMQSYINKQ